MFRELPEVILTDCPATYARPVAQGFDTVQEAFALVPTMAFVRLLEEAQAEARDLRDDLTGTVELDLNGEKFQCHATGAKGGTRWRLENDDFLLLIRSPKADWSVNVRYLSAGLWEHGLDELRARVLWALGPYTDKADSVFQRTIDGSDFIRVSRIDYCFDFHSPAFTREFKPGALVGNLVCHSSTKGREQGHVYDCFGKGGQGQTLTAGTKSGLQVQLYDKTLEIDEASGKTWLYDVWLTAVDGEWIFGDVPRPKDVWRLECRFSGDFLKERNLHRPGETLAAMPELIAEALYRRRLGVPLDSDSNRWRWPLHPIWSEAARRNSGEVMRPIGPKITEARAALLKRAEQAIAGSIRSAVVLQNGDYDEAVAFDLLEMARARIQADPKHGKKVLAAQSRYKRAGEAR